MLFTQFHVIDNPGIKEHLRDQTTVFPSLADGKSINSFGPRAPPSRTKPGQMERIMTRKTICGVGSSENIQMAKMDRVEHPIIVVDNVRPIVSFEIKVAGYPPAPLFGAVQNCSFPHSLAGQGDQDRLALLALPENMNLYLNRRRYRRPNRQIF